MAKESLIAGLDIGSNQICCVAGIWDDSQRIVNVIDGKIIPCYDGIKAGAVVDIQEASKSIEKAFIDTETAVNGQIDILVLSLRGDFIKMVSAKGMARISRGDIADGDIENALENASDSMKLPAEQEILQMLPKKFILDGNLNVLNPIGMEASFVEADVHVLAISSINLRNILKAANSIKVNYDKVYSYVAASEILARKEEKESGCLIVDFGGYTTGLVQYFDGMLQYSDEIPVGSEHITRDLMLKLRTSHQEATRIKIEQGAAFCHPDKFQNRDFDYITADGVTKAESSRQDIVENVIMPRVDQIICYVAQKIEEKSNIQTMPGSIILTGGGSRLDFMAEAFEKFFDGRPFVRIGIPLDNKVAGKREIITNLSFCAAIGAINSYYSNYSALPGKAPLQGKLGRAASWFKEIF